ncbi:hypothetical protein BASA81_000991 [Batrachochytrium salamandrivorans]|nr:hypothetical protein BASA81_000991 [Batrachochytrium salamandrivorans]
MQSELNAQLRLFGEQLTRLVYPVNRLEMDPLVMSAHSFASRYGPDGGNAVVGCVETQILRSRPDQKYAIYLLVDALCRARSGYSFKDRFAINLEAIFVSAYLEADAEAKEKLSRLLGIWLKKFPHELVFDLDLVGRIKAKIDPSFHYTPLTKSVAPVVPLYHHPLPTPQPPIVMAPVPPQELVYDIAERLLRKIHADRNLPPDQQYSLRQVYAMHPAFYQNLMAQASEEAKSAMAKVSNPPSQFLSPQAVLPSPFASLPMVSIGSTSISIPMITPVSSFSLSDHSVGQRTERLGMEIGFLIHTSPPAPIKALIIPPGQVTVRGWMPPSVKWITGEPTNWECVVRLFGEDPVDPALLQENEHLALAKEKELKLEAGPESSVPKDDSQTTCPLSGEGFETFWDNDRQMWMYKQAIRPVPGGPIYRLEAWLAQHPNYQLSSNEPAVKRFKI